MSQKQETLVFSSKLKLIKKHLGESTHPMRLLRKAFSLELDNYYRLSIASVDRKADGKSDQVSYIGPL